MFVPWDPATEAVRRLRIDDGPDREVSRGLRRATTRRSRSRTRRRSATATRRSSSFPASGSFGFGKDKREARITTEFFVNAIHVMSGANALEADQASDGAVVPQVRPAGAGEGVQDLPQLRRAAARRGVPDRVLGARRGQAAADAAREGIQPQGRRRRRRRQRHRPGSGAADREARRACRGRRSERAGRGRGGGGGREARRRRRWCSRRRSI